MKMAKDARVSTPYRSTPTRKPALELFKLATIPLPAPSDPVKQDELTKLAAGLEADYGRGKYCPPGKPAARQRDHKTMATSRDAAELLEVWRGWHAIAPPMKPRYERFVCSATKARKSWATGISARYGGPATT